MALDLTCLETRQAKMRLRNSSAVGGRHVTTLSSSSVMRPVSASWRSRPPETCLTTGRGGAGRISTRRRFFFAEKRSRASAVNDGAAIDADDAAKCGDGIGGERLLIGLENAGFGCSATWVGVLDDDHCGIIEFLG